ncbi:uncharacterized protein LOC133782484 [Humulus lupulus]|uniref:uncharacterized protein LOC133782484 n=1 Tax=Humulus lupulus TaxID=3486 RepID=UPI002B40AA6C|nr:uncharacterized protein LOC133782484 [Humulus lupulus]
MGPKKNGERSDSTVELGQEMETLKTEVSDIKNSMESMASRIQQQLQETLQQSQREFQESLQQQFKTLWEIQERSKNHQESREDGNGASGSQEKGQPRESAAQGDPQQREPPSRSRLWSTGASPPDVFRGSRNSGGSFFDRGQQEIQCRHENRLKRLKVPSFNGENPDGWIMQAERFFVCHEYDEEEKVEAAFISFSGDALLWYQYESNKRNIHNWEELKKLLLRHFRDQQEGSLYDQFLTVKQEGTVSEYKRKFIRLLAPLGTVEPAVQLSTFLNGLTPSLWAELRIMRPRNVDEAMEIVQDIEDKNRVARQQYNYTNKSAFNDTSLKPVKPSPSPATIAIRRLTESEIQLKRQKGLCF